MPITIREATTDDFAAATALLEELGRPAVLGTPEEGVHRERFGGWLAEADRLVFLAVDDDGSVVGLADLCLLARPNFTTDQAWIRLESAHWRTRAHAFYLREGYTDSGKSFDKLLADVDWPPRPGRG